MTGGGEVIEVEMNGQTGKKQMGRRQRTEMLEDSRDDWEKRDHDHATIRGGGRWRRKGEQVNRVQGLIKGGTKRW